MFNPIHQRSHRLKSLGALIVGVSVLVGIFQMSTANAATIKRGCENHLRTLDNGDVVQVYYQTEEDADEGRYRICKRANMSAKARAIYRDLQEENARRDEANDDENYEEATYEDDDLGGRASDVIIVEDRRSSANSRRTESVDYVDRSARDTSARDLDPIVVETRTADVARGREVVVQDRSGPDYVVVGGERKSNTEIVDVNSGRWPIPNNADLPRVGIGGNCALYRVGDPAVSFGGEPVRCSVNDRWIVDSTPN